MSVASALLPKAEAVLPSDGLDAVQAMIMDSLRQTSLAPMIEELSGAIGGGKMLRARLALKVGAATSAPCDTLLRAAAAVEMVHAASLLHDDVIDGGVLRRGIPSFWKKKSVSGAILLGDLLVCKAVQMLDGIENGRLGGMLVRLAGEMCDAEAEQELVTGGSATRLGVASGKAWVTERGASWEKCVSVARRKTGSLFAFAAAATDGSDEKRAEALLEAGYRIGTAYQLADDILDVRGTAVGDGKNLGQDALNGKRTSVSAAGGTDTPARQHIAQLCADSSQLLVAWPPVQEAWNE
ncbi:MAG: polyprenyl synthetase family protein, partial [Kiritimatiellota bacterium]|nr:polyprenyl synthetase family protein [Kiritimatiellota bacterium]